MQEINDNFKLEAPKPIDYRELKPSGSTVVPYASVAEANSSIDSAVRYPGLMVKINDGSLKLYWYKDGITDGDLVEYVPTIDVSSAIPTQFKFVQSSDLDFSNTYYWAVDQIETYRLGNPVSLDTYMKTFKLLNPSVVNDHAKVNIAYSGGNWQLEYAGADAGSPAIIPLNNTNDSNATVQYHFEEKGWYQFIKLGNYWYQTAFAKFQSTSIGIGLKRYQILIKGVSPVTEVTNSEWVGATFLMGTRSGAPIYLKDSSDLDTDSFDVFDNTLGKFTPAVALDPALNEILVIVVKLA